MRRLVRMPLYGFVYRLGSTIEREWMELPAPPRIGVPVVFPNGSRWRVLGLHIPADQDHPEADDVFDVEPWDKP